MLSHASHATSNEIDNGGVRRSLLLILWLLTIGLGVCIEGHFYYFPLFATGYFIRDWGWPDHSLRRSMVGSCLVFALMAIIRIGARYYFDGTSFYDFCIVPLCMSVISLCITTIIFDVCRLWKKVMEEVSSNVIFRFLDKYNFYIYIVHFFWVPVIYKNFGWGYGTIISLITVCISSMADEELSKFMQEKLLK